MIKGVLRSHGCWLRTAGWRHSRQPQPNSRQPVSVNQDSLTIQDFSKRVDEYVKLRKRMEGRSVPLQNQEDSGRPQTISSVPGTENSARSDHRRNAGDIFTPADQRLFRKLIATPFESGDGSKIRASLRHAEPVTWTSPAMNQQYPQTVAMQSTPPTLLSDLPKLPAEIEYRIVGRELILLDTAASLVVDLLPDALPCADSARRNRLTL